MQVTFFLIPISPTYKSYIHCTMLHFLSQVIEKGEGLVGQLIASTVPMPANALRRLRRDTDVIPAPFSAASGSVLFGRLGNIFSNIHRSNIVAVWEHGRRAVRL